MSFASRAAGWLCLVIVLVAAASTPVSAANYYVRTTGNDSNSGTSKNAAYRTVQKAVSKASAGDRVYIGAGTYSESITFPRDGNLLQSIRFIGDTNGTKTGDAGTVVITAPGIVMDLSSDNFIQLEKLTISGGTTGIRIASGLGVVVQECTVQNTAGIGIDVTNSVVIIERTAVSGPTGKGISFNGSSYILVNCLIQDAGGIGLHSKSVSLLSVATHVTVVRSSSDGILHDGGLLALYDTISANCSGRGLVQSSGLMTHDYNVVYNNTGGNFSGTSKQSHESIDDPKFLSASDFHLQSSGSSAMDQGTYLLVNEDLEGTKRPAGGRVDIGCYEGSGSGGGVVTSKEYYVRATGDDTKSGRSPASAFRTLTKAASVVTPGETVYVGAGTFTGVVELSNKAGTVTDKIQFLADTTGAKTGDAGDVIVDGAFYLRYSSYIVVDGFSVATAGSRPSWSTALAGVYADQSPDVELKSLSVTGGEHAIFATGAQNLSVVQCEATNATSHTYAFTASTTATVQDCMSEAAGGSGFYAAASTVNVSGAETHASASRGYHFATSGGSISSSSSADDGLGAELVGLTGNATSLNVSGLTIEASQQGGALLRDCTAVISGGTRRLCNSGAYGIYADRALVTLQNMEITGVTYGVQAYGSSQVTMSNSNLFQCSTNGILLDASQATVANSTISHCGVGISGQNDSTLNLTSSTLQAHTNWGIHHTGFGALTSCQIQDCGQGLYLSGASERGDITLENVTIQGSQADGLVAIRCTGNATGGDGGFSQGGEYGAYLYDSALTLSDAAVSGAEYGISAFQSELDLQQATVEDCTIDGLFLDQTSASVTDSAIRGCRYGIRSENNGTLQVSGCELTGHRDWAIHHAGYGSVADSTVSGNERGLYLVGATTRGDVTLSNTGVEDMDQEGLSLTRCIADVPAGTNWLSSGGDYGIYLNDSQLIIATPQIRQAQLGFQCQDSTLQASNAVIDHCTQDAVSAAGSQLEFSGCQVSHCRQGFALTDSSSLTLSQATLSDLALDGVSSDGSSVTITASAIVRARSGLRGVNASTLHASATTVDDTTAWGIYHTGYGTLTGCTLTGCGQGLYLLGATQSSDVQFSEMRIQNTAGEGLVAMQCMGTISGSGARLSQGGAYGAYCSHATVTFDDVSIISAQYGVIADQSTLTLQDSDISSTTAGGILATSSTLNLSNTTVTDCGTRGVDCQSSSTVTATGCRIERCADWGLVLAGTGTLTDCVIHDNQHGAYLTGAAQRGDIQLVRLTLGESAGQGLVAIRCDGDITGDNGFSGGGEWGLYANDSRLTLAGATLTSNTYGVYSTLSNVTLSGCHVQDAAHGVYSSADQNVSLTRSRIDGSTVWGLQSLQGNLQLVNCVLANNANGLHLANTLMANVWNVTVVGNMTYGVHQEGGLVQLRNTIVAGGGEHGTGLHCTGGSLLTAHNLVYGFATPFVGVTPDADTLVKNPRFVDQDGGDYRLAKGSPAINTGVDLVGTVDQDYLGQSRPAFRRWEIGAYEYLADDGSLRILQWTEQR